MEPRTLLYLYGVVPADAPEPDAALPGVEDGAVRVIREDALAAIVGEVPAAAYSAEALDERLADLAWVGVRALAHERVLTWYADRAPVVPMSPFSLHYDESRVRERLRNGVIGFRRLLDRLRGRRQWGFRAWRLPAAAARLADASPRLLALRAEIEAASAGRRFLLEKKLAAVQQDELRAATREWTRAAFASLDAAAEAGVALPIAAAAGAERVLVLDAAFLVDENAFEDFQRRVTEAAHDAAERGFEVEFTGPWPAYHFAGPNDA